MARNDKSPTSPRNFKQWVADNSSRIERAQEHGALPYFLRDNGGRAQVLYNSQEEKDSLLTPREELEKEWDIVDLGSDYEKSDVGRFGLNSRKDVIREICKAEGSEIGEYSDNCFEVTIYSEDNWSFRVKVDTKDSTFSLMREFERSSDGRINCDHTLFTLPESWQGKGYSKQLFRELYNRYQKIGVSTITVHANIYVGGYTWARYGFSAYNKQYVDAAISFNESRFPDATLQAQDIVDEYYRDNGLSDDKPFPMNLLTGHPWSKDLLLGSEWQGILDFADKAQRLVWENYLKG